MTSSQRPPNSPADDEAAIILDDDGGGPAVATGTPREKAEHKPAAVQDSASAQRPAVGETAER
ncbi:MAG TPA: hypothetical protein VM287_01370 [Egibacteraceae bacterium]|nr:hypothetical protein [Egibacteraceae bacterium]HVM20186.1 hypothetical protein [Egibacteraceae bacterium]